jgi:hypothetical protein
MYSILGEFWRPVECSDLGLAAPDLVCIVGAMMQVLVSRRAIDLGHASSALCLCE